jgi:hypothetical protein
MKFNKIFILLISLIFLVLTLNLISANVDVNYKAHYAIIKDNGHLTEMSDSINNYGVVGYTCFSQGCSIISDVPVASLTKNTISDTITLTFPTQMNSEYGYVLYFYKEGYIGWEQSGVKVWGTLQDPIDAPDYVYLSQKNSGHAPIMDFNVVNEIEPHKLIEVGFEVNIDADTFSAIERNTFSPIPLNEEVKTKVSLEVKNDQDNIIYQEIKYLSISYSESKYVSFEYEFDESGDYEIVVYTDIEDEKIINSIRQSASSIIAVVENLEDPYSYSLLQGLNFYPQLPKINEDITFNFDYLSNYVNKYQEILPVETLIKVFLYKEGNLLKSNSFVLDANSDPEIYSSFSFEDSFSEKGNYHLKIKAVPNTDLGDALFESVQEIDFIIKPVEEVEDLYLNILSPIQSKTYSSKNILVNLDSNANNLDGSVWFVYDGKTRAYSSPVLIEFEEGDNTLKAYAKDSDGNIISKTVNFKIDLEEVEEKVKKSSSYQNKEFVNERDVIILGEMQSGQNLINSNAMNEIINEENKKDKLFLKLINYNIFLLSLLILIVLILILITKRVKSL